MTGKYLKFYSTAWNHMLIGTREERVYCTRKKRDEPARFTNKMNEWNTDMIAF